MKYNKILYLILIIICIISCQPSRKIEVTNVKKIELKLSHLIQDGNTIMDQYYTSKIFYSKDSINNIIKMLNNNKKIYI
jgi:hypothetical protein